VPGVSVDGASPIGVDTERALHSPACVVSGGAGEKHGRLHGLHLCDFYDGTLDPASTVRVLADRDLADLADALFVHLDLATPAFGALSWFELATEELRRRRGTDAEL
jgi:hypothetical protein